jgi:class 3 adenylate cyclase
MKTDIAGSTPRFRALLASDQQSLLREHRAFVGRHAADQGGHITRSAGDGYWLEFPSVTAATRSAIAMQEALSLEQFERGDDRLSMRAVIGLGDVSVLDGEPIGELLALMVRIEAITPGEEIYLTSAAHAALVHAEVQTTVVGDFPLKGFPELVSVYRVQQRHRTQVIANAYILLTDLRGFTQMTESRSVVEVEQVLTALDAMTRSVAEEFSGRIRYSIGDSHCLTFAEASQAIGAAERLSAVWHAAGCDGRFDCAINIAVHRGNISAFRSFLYGEGIMVAAGVQRSSAELLGPCEGGIFVTSAVRDDLADGLWQSRLELVAVRHWDARYARPEIYRLGAASPATVRRAS